MNSHQFQEYGSTDIKKGINSTTGGGNGNSMEKSADEQEDDIVQYPAYLKYGKMYDTSSPYISNYRPQEN